METLDQQQRKPAAHGLQLLGLWQRLNVERRLNKSISLCHSWRLTQE